MKIMMNFLSDTTMLMSILLVILCVLASLDLWRQYALNDMDYWFSKYVDGVKVSSDSWKLGFRLEDLEIKIDDQKKILDQVTWHTFATPWHSVFRNEKHDFMSTRRSRLIIHSLIHNESAIFEIGCGSEGPLLRIGVNDFRGDSRDECQIFAGGASTISGANTMFEVIHLEEELIALRSISNDLFLRAVPPPADNPDLPWKLMIGGPLAGSAERFRVTSDGYLYSPLLGGFFQCSSGQAVLGYSGMYGSFSKFKLKLVEDSRSSMAQELVSLSNKIKIIQETHLLSAIKAMKSAAAAPENSIAIPTKAAPLRICMGVPMTSKGTVMKDVTESPFWSNLFDSFMKSIDWKANKYIFRFYLGFDKADDFYDTGDAWSELRDEFKHRATFRMTEQMMDEEAIQHVLDHYLSLKLMHFEHLEGAPTQVVSQLMLAAYVDNFDYFYQVNDDTIIVSPNWAPKLVQTLQNNPIIPNFGVTGPSDSNNEKIFTHSFVHRSHIEVFGHLFPPSFKNWWSDDWISTVYGPSHTFRPSDVLIKHNVGAQKQHGTTRYEVDHRGQLILEEELLKGYVQIDRYLKKNSLPRLTLPTVCGFSPLVRHLAPSVRAKKALVHNNS